MLIKNVKIFCEDKRFRDGNIYIEGDKFQKIEYTDSDSESVSDKSPVEEVIDGQGLYAVPGLIDVHFHGCMGYDFCDGTREAVEKIAEYEADCGITTIVPATMTLSEEELCAIMENAAAYENEENAYLAGVHLEGPFINSSKKGAQKADHIREPDVGLFYKLQEKAKGKIRLITVAPELQGAQDFIEELKDKVHISFGHSEADYETAKKGYELGADHLTHTFNAMSPFHHRDPGLVGAAWESPKCYAELICDGVHIHGSMVRAAFELFGDDRIVLISDSMRGTGLADGVYTLGGQEVQVRGKEARLVCDGAIAGSVSNLMDCVRTAVTDMKIPLESVLACATINAAKSVGLYDEVGSVTEGKRADLLLLDQQLNIKEIIIRGKRK